MTRTSLATGLALLALASGTAFVPTPPRPDGILPGTFVTVAAGEYHTCALATDSTAYCWGLNNSGQLGNTSSDQCALEKQTVPCATRPLAVRGGLRFATLIVGSYHSCGLQADGRLFCWGENGTGQLGPTPINQTSDPIPLESDLRFTQGTAGERHTCGLTSDSLVYCWGRDDYGQVGSESAVQSCTLNARQVPCQRTPLLVQTRLKLSSLSAGYYHTCALSQFGQPYCWGREFQRSPTQVPGGRSLAVLSAGGPAGRGCGLTGEGYPYGWGGFLAMDGKRVVETKLLRQVFGCMPRLQSYGPGRYWGEFEREEWPWQFTSVSTGGFHVCGLTVKGIASC